MILAEKLLLCLTDDATGKLVVVGDHADIGVGGAILVELALRGRIRVARPGDEVAQGRLLVQDASPTGDQLLDSALATVSGKQGKKPKSVVALVGRHLRAPLYERLTAAGVLRHEDAKVLGLIPTRRWPTQDDRPESRIRADIASALRTGAAEEAHVAALISLLLALDVLNKVVDPHDLGLTSSQMRNRARTIAEGDWASQAVRQAIDSLNAAIIAATTSVVVARGSHT